MLNLRKISFKKQIFFGFSDVGFFNQRYQYYKQIGQHLNMRISKINYELQFANRQLIHLYGIKGQILQQQVEKQQIELKQQKTLQQSTQKKQLQQVNQSFEYEDQYGQKVSYKYDKMNKQIIQFEIALKIAQELKMDLCVLQQAIQYPKLILRDYRKHIYQKFYQKYIQKKKDNAYKIINVTQKTQIFDLIHKAKNIQRLIQEGSRKFKINSDCDSDNAKQNIIKICQLINQKNVDVILQDKQKRKYKTQQYDEKWVTYINIEKQKPLDTDFIEKKFKRMIISQRVAKFEEQNPKKRKKIKLEQLPIQLQSQYLKFCRETGTPFPQQFKDLQQIMKSVQKGTLINDTFQQGFEKQEFDHQNLTQDFFKVQKYSKQSAQQIAKYMKQSKKDLRMRSIDQIIQQIESIKRGTVSLSSYDIYRLKKLQNQLHQTIRISGYSGKV